jgi:ribosomal protein S10
LGLFRILEEWIFRQGKNVGYRTEQPAQLPLFSKRQARVVKSVKGENSMAYDQQFERGDIQRLVTQSERHVRVLAAVVETMLPHHTVEMSRDNNGVLGLQTGNRLQRQYVLRGPNPEEDFSVFAPFLPDEPEEHLRIHFASEIAQNKATK